MSLILGCYTDRTRPLAPLLAALGEARLTHPANEAPVGFGIAYYQETQALLQRKPRVTQAVAMDRAAGDIRSTALVAHAGPVPAKGMPKVNDIPPFRFGPWMLALEGTLPGEGRCREALEAQLPDSLRRNLRGDTDGELFFHLFLSRLHDAGISPRGWAADPADVLRALADTFETWRLAAREAGDERPARVAVILSNGQGIGGLRLGAALCLAGLRLLGDAVEPVAPDELAAAEQDHRGRGASAGWLLAGATAGEACDAPFEPVEDGGMIWIDRDHRISRHPIR